MYRVYMYISTDTLQYAATHSQYVLIQVLFSYKMWHRTLIEHDTCNIPLIVRTCTYPSLTKRGVSSAWASPHGICFMYLYSTHLHLNPYCHFSSLWSPVSVISLSPVVITDWDPAYPSHLNSLTPWSIICNWICIFTVSLWSPSSRTYAIRKTQFNEGTNDRPVHKTGGGVLSGRGARCHNPVTAI